METQNETIFCIGLVNSGGVKFWSKCWFFMERQKVEYFYYDRKKVKHYIGYPVEMYDGKQKLQSEPGEWYVKRQCFETINAKGNKDVWYDNDKNMIVRVSKYGNKLFKALPRD